MSHPHISNNEVFISPAAAWEDAFEEFQRLKYVNNPGLSFFA